MLYTHSHMHYTNLVRRLRNDPRLFDESDEHKIHRILRKAIRRMAIERRVADKRERKVGPYSGLTSRELASSGTCETDWF